MVSSGSKGTDSGIKEMNEGRRPPLQVTLGVMLPQSSVSSGLVCSDTGTVSMGFSQPSEDSSNLYAPILLPESGSKGWENGSERSGKVASNCEQFLVQIFSF